MHWFWQVRIHNDNGDYCTIFVKTGRNLDEINAIQDFYLEMTGCRMLLEGMSEQEPIRSKDNSLQPFHCIWRVK